MEQDAVKIEGPQTAAKYHKRRKQFSAYGGGGLRMSLKTYQTTAKWVALAERKCSKRYVLAAKLDAGKRAPLHSGILWCLLFQPSFPVPCLIPALPAKQWHFASHFDCRSMFCVWLWRLCNKTAAYPRSDLRLGFLSPVRQNLESGVTQK